MSFFFFDCKGSDCYGKKTIRTEKDILGGEKYNTIKESYDNEAFMKQRKYCLLGLLIILLVLSGCVVNKDRNGEDATEECNSEITTDTEEMDEEALVAGRYYEYCKNGEMYQSELLSIETPLDFHITLNKDGTYEWYDCILSSYMGMGQYTVDNGILTMTEKEYVIEGRKSVMKDPDPEKGGMTFVNHFRIDGDKLIYISEGSTNFLYVRLQDGDVFNAAEPVNNMEVDPREAGLTMEVMADTVTPAGCKMNLSNNGKQSYKYVPAVLFFKIKEDGTWYDLANIGPFEESEEQVLEGNTEKIIEVKWDKAYGKFEPGEYRIIMSMYYYRNEGGSVTVEVTDDFTIK